jgi:hypothetical protein
VPRPTSLVVKNGSKMRSATSPGMPQPVSATLITTESPSVRVRISIRPRTPESPTTSETACAALTTRLISTWLMSLALQTTVGSSASAMSMSAR